MLVMAVVVVAMIVVVIMCMRVMMDVSVRGMTVMIVGASG